MALPLNLAVAAMPCMLLIVLLNQESCSNMQCPFSTNHHVCCVGDTFKLISFSIV